MHTSAAQDTKTIGQQDLHDDVAEKTAAAPVGLEFPRYFTRPGVDPFDEVEWELRAAVIGSEKGEVVFEQRDVEIPRFWSQQATNIVVSKYFRGQMNTAERERSVRAFLVAGVERDRLWQRWVAVEPKLDGYAGRRSTETPVIVLEPRDGTA